MSALPAWFRTVVVSLIFLAISNGIARGSDHGDTNRLIEIGRHDARITDFHAFTRGGKLVLAVSTNPMIPSSATDYSFPDDLTLRIHIDNNSPVSFDDPEDLRVFGGTVLFPAQIEEDVVFEIAFQRRGQPRLDVQGLPRSALKKTTFFTGLRDDPFIRGPRIGRNVAAVIIELPLELVIGPQPTVLLWATSKIPEMGGPYSDLAGRSLRSQFSENMAINTLHPKDHLQILGLRPDVMIYDTSRPCAFPNGRELNDDVVDLVGDSRVLSDDAPFPTTNDVPFLAAFPYLAPPHGP